MKRGSIIFLGIVLVLLLANIALANAQTATTTTVQPLCPSQCDLDIVFTLDVSGSMAGEPIWELRNATILFINLTCPDCAWSIGIVAFKDYAFNVTQGIVEVCTENDKETLRSAVKTLTASGSTNMGDGIYNATAMLVDYGRPGAKDVIIVVSDGEPNVGPDATTAADEAKNLGITIVGIFVGSPDGTGDEYLRDNIVTDPDIHFINASIGSGINMTEAFAQLAGELCEIVVETEKVGGIVEKPNVQLADLGKYVVATAIVASAGIALLLKRKE